MAKGAVLIVEDNPMNLDIAQELLQHAGFKTIAAEEAENAIRLAQQEVPDLILLDLHLPGKDGFEACREIKAIPTLTNIPVIAFTALAMAEDTRKAYESGCNGVISKPIDVETFAATVESFIK